MIKPNVIMRFLLIFSFVLVVAISGAVGASSQEKPVGKVKWLVFSSTKYQRERELVIRHEHVTRNYLKGGSPLYIALADLNDDGNPEVFAYMALGGGYCGTMGCPMNFYQRKGQKLAPLFWDGFLIYIDIDKKGHQKVLGILPTKTMGWHDIALYDSTVWKWNGKEYDAASTEQGK